MATCVECGLPQFDTPSGVTCANGHGGAEGIDPLERKRVIEEARTAGGDAAADMADQLMPLPTVDRLVETYIKIREARAAATSAYEKRDKELRKQLEMVENALLARAQAEGVTGFKSEHGTTYTETSINCSGADWNAFYTWEGFTPDMLERRIKGSAIKEYMEQHEGRTPPGINVYTQLRMKVRKA